MERQRSEVSIFWNSYNVADLGSRYWDMIYGAKLQRIERQLHHYGSGLNALPLISEFMAHPTDYHLLQVGFGGLSGPLSNIDQVRTSPSLSIIY